MHFADDFPKDPGGRKGGHKFQICQKGIILIHFQHLLSNTSWKVAVAEMENLCQLKQTNWGQHVPLNSLLCYLAKQIDLLELWTLIFMKHILRELDLNNFNIINFQQLMKGTQWLFVLKTTDYI